MTAYQKKVRNTLKLAVERLMSSGEHLQDDTYLDRKESQALIEELSCGTAEVQVELSGGILHCAGCDKLLGQLVHIAVVDFDVDGEDGNAIAISASQSDRNACWEYGVSVEEGAPYKITDHPNQSS